MKKTLIIATLFLINLSIFSNYPPWLGYAGKGAQAAAFIGVPLTVAYIHFWYHDDHFENGFILSSGFDIKMLSEGNADIMSRISYKINRFQPGIDLELFPSIGYEGYGTFLNYSIIDRKMALLSGCEITRIINKQVNNYKVVTSYGINNEIRYIVNSKIAISVLTNLKTRPELSDSKPDMILSNYLQLNLKL